MDPKVEVKSTAVMVGEKGIVPLPDNFEKMSERKQKNILLSVLIEYNNSISTDVELDDSEAKEQRKLTALIKNSKEGKRLAQLRQAKIDRKKQREMLLIERNGVLKVCKRMGLEITEEVKRLKEVNQ